MTPHKTLAINFVSQAVSDSTDNATLKVQLESLRAEYESNVEATAQITKDQVSLYVRNELEGNAKKSISTFLQGLLTVVSILRAGMLGVVTVWNVLRRVVKVWMWHPLMP